MGVFGIGALGRHHTRILSSFAGVTLEGIFDTRPEVAAAIAAEHGAKVAASFDELAGKIDAAVLAAPTTLHGELGLALLERGVHLLVEKPIASTLAEADALIAAAEARDRVLAVGHVEFHNPAVQALLDAGSGPRFVEIERLGTFSPRSLDVDVILDLMIHDLQILQAMDDSPVVEVRATGIPVLSDRIDIANAQARLRFRPGGERHRVARFRRARPQAPRLLPRPLPVARLPGAGDQGLPPRLERRRAGDPAGESAGREVGAAAVRAGGVRRRLPGRARPPGGRPGRAAALATALEVVAAAAPTAATPAGRDGVRCVSLRLRSRG